MDRTLSWLDVLLDAFRPAAPARRVAPEPPGDCELCEHETAVEGSAFCFWCQPGL